MVARSAGQNVRTNKENATTAALTVTAAEKDLKPEMDVMTLLEDQTNINVF